MTLVAGVYARVSTNAQASGDKISLQDQERECRALAKKDGYSVPPNLIFVDRVSGTLDETERPAFGKMLKAARAREFTRLYFLKIDRLGRDQAIISGALKDLAKAGVEFVSVRDPDLQNPLLRSILGGVAEYEATEIRRRTGRGKLAKREQGLWVMGEAPYGYRRRPDQTLEQDPFEAPVLRRIYEMTRDGMGRIAISRRLNSEGVEPPYAYVLMPGREKERRLRTNMLRESGGLDAFLVKHGATVRRPPRWNESNLTKLIGKTIYYGELHGVVMRIYPAPIVSKQLYDHALASSSSRYQVGSAPQKPKLLTGLIRCGNPQCGRAYVYHMGNTKRRHSLYYQCQGRRSGTGCTSPHVRLDAADTQVMQTAVLYLTERLNRGHFYEFLMAHGRQKIETMQGALREAQEALGDLQRKRTTLMRTATLMTASGAEANDLIELTADVRTLTPQIDGRQREVNDLIAELGRTEATMALDEREARDAAAHAEHALWIDAPTSDFEKALYGDPRDLLRLVVKTVTVRPDRTLDAVLDRSDDALVRVIRHLSELHLDSVRKLEELGRRHGVGSEGTHKADMDPAVVEGIRGAIEAWHAIPLDERRARLVRGS